MGPALGENVLERFSSLVRVNVLLVAATLFLFIPTGVWLIQAWWSDPYYSHGPLVLAVTIYFLWSRREAATERLSAPEPGGWVVLVLALGVHLWATAWRAYYISALMIPPAFLGLALVLFGRATARRLSFPLFFLFLMVPLPLAERFGPMLEGWTAVSATFLAQRFGIAAQNVGSQVVLPNTSFTVGLPCGGLRSVIAIITLVTLVVYIVRGPRWARGLIWLGAIPIALAANTLRIALLFVIASQWGAQVGMDYFHSWSSPVLFLLALALVLGLARGMGCSRVRWEVVLPA